MRSFVGDRDAGSEDDAADPGALRERVAELERQLEQARAAEKAQRGDRARLDLLLEQLPTIIYTLDANLVFTSSLGSGLRKIGLEQNQVLGESLEAFLQQGSDADRVLGNHRAALEGREGDYEHQWADRTFHVHVRPMREPDGRISGVIGAAYDITEHRAAEEALRDEARQQLRLIREAIEHVTDMVIITEARLDRPGPRIVYANPAFERVTGYTAEELLGQTPRILQGPRTDPRVIRRLRTQLDAGLNFEGETVNYRKDGSPYVVQWQIAPVRDAQGRVVNWVSIQRDVTEQRRQQELARQREAELAHAARLSTIGEMASGLAHELNQPLAAIANYANGCLERLRQDRLSRDELAGVLQRIAGQADRSGEIIRRMRRFIRKREPQREPTRIDTLVRDVSALMEGELRRHQTQLNLEIPEDLPTLCVDSIQIQQVLLNLLRNGLEAMSDAPAEERQLSIRASASDGVAKIAVSDRGPAISEEAVKRMFAPFFTTKAAGMGVGLNISETLVQAHGGRLVPTRQSQRGLCITIELPLPRSG